MNRCKPNAFIVGLLLLPYLLFGTAFAGGQQGYFNSGLRYTTEPSAEEMTLDAIVIRPVGLVTTIAGAAVYTVSLPFSLLGGNERAAREQLVYEPARFTFKRPLGEFSY